MRFLPTSRFAKTLSIMWAMGVLCLIILGTNSNCYATDDAVESGREALEKTGNYPWYDNKSDDLRRYREKKLKKGKYSSKTTSSDKTDSSEVDPKKTKETKSKKREYSSSSGGAVSTAFSTITWVIFCLLLAGLLAFIIWAIINRETDPKGTRTNEGEKKIEDRIEQLPLEIDPAKHDLLTAAQQEYNQGHYSKAIVYLFSYQLVELDKNQLIRLLKGKTNRQYLIELRSFNNLSTILATTIRYFEDAFFGKYEITQAQFEECWNQVDQFQKLLNQQPQS